jgi:nicotinate-nucleotide adenylyltransferase
MRRLCFGGSFNPIHNGHLICARAVAEQGGYDRVALIPSLQPPHKQADRDIAAASHRLELCRRAVAGDPLFEVDDIELNRPVPSYTIETARELRRRGWPEVHWLIGADMARDLPLWHEAANLLNEVHFVIMARPGWSFDWTSLPAEFRHLERQVVTAPLIDISSTDIRRRLAGGKSIRYMTPPAVGDYIQSHRLYQGA